MPASGTSVGTAVRTGTWVCNGALSKQCQEFSLFPHLRPLLSHHKPKTSPLCPILCRCPAHTPIGPGTEPDRLPLPGLEEAPGSSSRGRIIYRQGQVSGSCFLTLLGELQRHFIKKQYCKGSLLPMALLVPYCLSATIKCEIGFYEPICIPKFQTSKLETFYSR